MIPSRNTAVNANCHEYPIPSTTVNAKNAFSPIPGARANGRFAVKAITRVAIADERAVAVKIAPKSIPVSLKKSGFTMRIYAIVRNVVRPATTSVFTSVPCSFSLKNFSIFPLLRN